MGNLILPLMLALMAGFMFFSIRNQKKRAAAQAEMQNSLAKGARVQLHSGLFATVVDPGVDEEGLVNNESVLLEISPGVVTEWNRLAIRETVSPEEEITENDSADDFSSIDRPSDNEQNEEK
ncbi:preprotein translocase subunit YajC [Gordonia sp. (in: high G+C Gram-positive bacteria)]|uniref:preprotein translocase subunit YajC n=1 Tax=Gordonia sp. (in: high G+C Gram-positive bacteria) TaxID=84139 RepID=UPI003C79244A